MMSRLAVEEGEEGGTERKYAPNQLSMLLFPAFGAPMMAN